MGTSVGTPSLASLASPSAALAARGDDTLTQPMGFPTAW